MNFSRLKYLALGTALLASSAYANATEQPNLGRIVKGKMESGLCNESIFLNYIILRRIDENGKFLGNSYHLTKKDKKVPLVDLTFERWLKERRFDKILEEFEPYPFVFVTEDKIYENKTPRESINFKEPTAYTKKRKVCDDIQKILEMERIRKTKTQTKEII